MHAELLYMWTCSKASLFVIESTVERKHDNDFVVAVADVSASAGVPVLLNRFLSLIKPLGIRMSERVRHRPRYFTLHAHSTVTPSI